MSSAQCSPSDVDISPGSTHIKAKRYEPRRKFGSNLINLRKESNSMHNIMPKGMSKRKLIKKEALTPHQMRSFCFKNGFGVGAARNSKLGLKNGRDSPGLISKKSAVDDSLHNIRAARNLLNQDHRAKKR